MKQLRNIAIIGSGPTALFLLNNIYKNLNVLKDIIHKITIFEKEKIAGIGMPYNTSTTDIYNLANISSEEIPMLRKSFAEWLKIQDTKTLKQLNISDMTIDESQVYSRIALGQYFQEQFIQILSLIKSEGVDIVEFSDREIKDISPSSDDQLILIDNHKQNYEFSAVIIANGHEWKEKDNEDSGYFASPWPIHKLLPKNNELYNFPVATLGASLSAFDVVTSLSHRHGKFVRVGKQLNFIKNKDVPDFKLILHSAEGWLPHLQYEQKEPIREIYRHFDRSQLLSLISGDGFMRIENYFDILCRSVLIKAFTKDNMHGVADKLMNVKFSFKDLVDLLSEKHEYTNSFEGMKLEMVKARNSVDNNIPINWMETLDDLMYSLNYHAELLPAEDHIFFNKEIMAFLMNVIAALPLKSAEILLALYDANAIELKKGFITFPKNAHPNGKTTIELQSDDGLEHIEYKMFINCGGQKKMELEDYPFPSLVKQKIVRAATTPFAHQKAVNGKDLDEDNIITIDGKSHLKLSGIDIDSSYRSIDSNGNPNNFLFDINFTHTIGLRPYSYGLQACNATSMILVESWIAKLRDNENVGDNIEKITELYEDVDDL